MKKILLLILTILSICFEVILAQENVLKKLVQTELDFSKLSETQGTKTAFLANLTEKSIFFRPFPVNGMKIWSESQDSTSLLTWFPIWAEVSAAGDLGFTTGPYVLSNRKNKTQAASYGNYITIWQKQNDGNFKILLDLGCSNPEPNQKMEVFNDFNSSTKKKKIKSFDTAQETETIKKNEQSTDIQLLKTSRFLRAGQFPLVGQTAIQAYLQTQNYQNKTYQADLVEIAQSGDLAYSYGKFSAQSKTENKTESGYYVRIWRKIAKQNWALALDIVLMNPK